MANVIKQEVQETVFTVELTQKELNTFTRFLGNTSESEFNKIMRGHVFEKAKFITHAEGDSVYRILRPLTNY